MSKKADRLDQAVSIVDRFGIVLVYPLPARPAVPSLWKQLYPRSPMRWSWNEDADPRVADLWHLRNRLGESGRVAYAKWFRGRATFFALPVFHALLERLDRAGDPFRGLAPESLEALELLREHGSMSTKNLRAALDLRGKPGERTFTRALADLWTRLLVVGIGEVEDGAFPSLAIGATETIFEDLWNARKSASEEARAALEKALTVDAFARQLERSCRSIRESSPRSEAFLL